MNNLMCGYWNTLVHSRPLPDTALFIGIFQSNFRADLIHSKMQLKENKIQTVDFATTFGNS